MQETFGTKRNVVILGPFFRPNCEITEYKMCLAVSRFASVLKRVCMCSKIDLQVELPHTINDELCLKKAFALFSVSYLRKRCLPEQFVLSAEIIRVCFPVYVPSFVASMFKTNKRETTIFLSF